RPPAPRCPGAAPSCRFRLPRERPARRCVRRARHSAAGQAARTRPIGPEAPADARQPSVRSLDAAPRAHTRALPGRDAPPNARPCSCQRNRKEVVMNTAESRTFDLFITRGVIAIAWAVVFAAAAGSLTLGTAVLLVLYPVIDVVASLIDARTQHGSA